VAALTESDLHTRFPWSKPVVPELSEKDKAEGYFCDPLPWDFEEPVLRLIEQMLTEIESYFTNRNEPVEIAIFGIQEIYGELHVEMYSSNTEVYEIVRKYNRLSREQFSNKED